MSRYREEHLIILGVDPSTRYTGLALISWDNDASPSSPTGKAITIQTVKIPQNASNKLVQIWQALLSLPIRPHLVSCECAVPFVKPRGRLLTLQAIYEVVGTIRLWTEISHIPLLRLYPAHIRSLLKLHPSTPKKKLHKHATTIIPKNLLDKCQTEHEMDALLMAWGGLCYLRGE